LCSVVTYCTSFRWSPTATSNSICCRPLANCCCNSTSKSVAPAVTRSNLNQRQRRKNCFKCIFQSASRVASPGLDQGMALGMGEGRFQTAFSIAFSACIISCFFRLTRINDTAAGVTPGIREAWPTVAGRCSMSFCFTSEDKPDTC